MSSVGEDYPVQQARCRDLLMEYKNMRQTPGVNVNFAIASIEDVLRQADEAAMSGDVVAMLRAYQEMKSCE